MLVIMKSQCTDNDIFHVTNLLEDLGLGHCLVGHAEQKIIEVLGPSGRVKRESLEAAPMVERVLSKSEPFLAGNRKPEDSTLEVPLGARALVGGNKLAVIAGPCSVESESRLMETAAAVKEAGAVGLRGGAFKPRTSPYSFQGLGEPGLEMLARAREETGLAIVTEVLCCEQAPIVAQYADVLQVGSRNMHNFHLLLTVGRLDKPVLLKRGWSASLDEYLLAAEYIMQAGNPNVILCERGIRTFESHTRNTLDLSVVPEVKRRSRLPIIVDPSHGTGRRHLIDSMSKAAVCCGADGLLVEVHPDPAEAWSDGSQTIDLNEFESLMRDLPAFAGAVGREV